MCERDEHKNAGINEFDRGGSDELNIGYLVNCGSLSCGTCTSLASAKLFKMYLLKMDIASE